MSPYETPPAEPGFRAGVNSAAGYTCFAFFSFHQTNASIYWIAGARQRLQFSSWKETNGLTVPINPFHSFAQPGTYSIKATRYLSDTKDWGKPRQPTGEVSGTFTIEIITPPSEALKDAFGPYLQDFRTGFYEQQHELELSLVPMLSMADLQIQAISGLCRLNTPKARAALLDLVRKDDQFTFE